jgi:hypothetical protein
MSKSTEYFSFSVHVHEEPLWGIRYMGPGRYALDLYKLTLRFECWWVRGGIKYL